MKWRQIISHHPNFVGFPSFFTFFEGRGEEEGGGGGEGRKMAVRCTSKELED